MAAGQAGAAVKVIKPGSTVSVQVTALDPLTDDPVVRVRHCRVLEVADQDSLSVSIGHWTPPFTVTRMVARPYRFEADLTPS